MFRIKTKIVSLWMLILLVVFVVLPEITNAAGLVPCGTTDNNRACTLCDFIVGIKGLIDFGTKLVTIAAIVAIFFAGIMYVISTGDEGMMTKAKGFMKSSLVGFTLIFTAWLIVNVVMLTLGTAPGMNLSITNWYTFSCSTKSSASSTVIPASQSPAAANSPYNVAGGSTTSNRLEGEACGEGAKGKCTGGNGNTCNQVWPGSSQLQGGDDCTSGKLCCILNSANGQPCGSGNAGTCISGNGQCPGNLSRVWGGSSCGSGYYCCK
jgi:hypothetical protein